jgi:hypothetical protein
MDHLNEPNGPHYGSMWYAQFDNDAVKHHS